MDSYRKHDFFPIVKKMKHRLRKELEMGILENPLPVSKRQLIFCFILHFSPTIHISVLQ